MEQDQQRRKAAPAASCRASTASSASSASSPSSSAPLVASTASAAPSMGIFYPLERDDSVNMLEEGEENALEAEAFADMAMSGMDMNLELNALQIRAFLARNEPPNENSGAFSTTQEESTSCSHSETLQVQAAATETKTSAYEVLRNGAVHYSRREDKVKALQEHPVVASVAADGRTVGCKCGRSVRLNPPWYILKFEQHVASRNCSFLRQSRLKKRKRTEQEQTGAEQQNDGRQELETGGLEGMEHGSREQGRDRNDRQEEEASGQVDEDGSGEYALQSVEMILRREFGVLKDGERIIVPPGDTSPDERVRMFKGATALRDNSHFSRITPDGRFAECKCARIVLLSGPWQPGQFLIHVADKQKPNKRAKSTSAGVTSAQWKNKRVDAAPKTMVGADVLMRPQSSASTLAQANKAKKSFPREIQWDIAQARGILPCPGLRDERMDTFVSSTVQLTGGARHRQKIARELFPHLFPDSLEYSHSEEADTGGELHQPSGRNSSKRRQPKLHQQLLEAEKLLLHDVIEGEALWFVDKDGNSVRSLNCLGIIDSGKGETRCEACAALRSNSALRTAAATRNKLATRPGPPRNPINRKFCSGRVCSLLEAEFDMQEPYARVLRDLALAEIPSGSGLNMWMEMATMGLSGDFNTHPALLGLTDAMVRLKDKEQRGVGLQNMTYSDLLDTFMRSLAELSPQACEFFQKHLSGRNQKQLLAMTSRAMLPNKRKLLPLGNNSGSDTPRVNQEGDSLYGVSPSNAVRVGNDEGFVHLLDPSVVGLGMPNLSIGDIQDVDLSSLPTSSGMQNHVHQTNMNQEVEMLSTTAPAFPALALSSETNQLGTTGRTSKESERNATVDSGSTNASDAQHLADVSAQIHDGHTGESNDAENEGQMESDPDAVAFLTELASTEDSPTDSAVMPSDHVPCTGLRDENVQAYVANAVQIVGGSRPRYVIARELFPRVFGSEKKVRIVDKLDNEQRLVLQDAVFSECLWRVDKEGRCVRSLRCKRFVPAADDHRGTSQNQGVCRACRDLRTVPNFRSVLSRSKVPRKLENIKYMPSVYTESDPFLRKLSKNSAFRGLYQTVKRMASPQSGDTGEVGAERLKEVHFWLRFARMGVFGHFKSHPVFEGLMKSMVEVKDKERRGVGKQNMQYSQALDEFMQGMAQISTEAFELFAAQFCGRTLRSQKVKRRASNTPPPIFSLTAQTSNAAAHSTETSTAVDTMVHTLPVTLPPPLHQHYLIPPDDLLGGRSLSTEESQRFMDRMLDEVRLSVSREMQLAEEEERRRAENAGALATEQQMHGDDDGSPEAYLNDEGVLTTEI